MRVPLRLSHTVCGASGRITASSLSPNACAFVQCSSMKWLLPPSGTTDTPSRLAAATAFRSGGPTFTSGSDGPPRVRTPTTASIAGSTSALISELPQSLVARRALVDPPANHRRLRGCGRRFPPGGIASLCDGGSQMRRTISLSAARPGAITAPSSPPLRRPWSVSSRSLPSALSGPWQFTHRLVRIGCTNVEYAITRSGRLARRCRGGAAGYSPEPCADRGGGVLREITLAVRQRRAEVTRNGDDDDGRGEQCAVHRSLPVPAGGSGAQQSSHTRSARRQWPPRPQAARATRTSARRSCRCRRAGNQRPRQPAPRWRPA